MLASLYNGWGLFECEVKGIPNITSGWPLWDNLWCCLFSHNDYGVWIIILATWKLRTKYKFNIIEQESLWWSCMFSYLLLQFPCSSPILVYLKLWSSLGMEVFHRVVVVFKIGSWAQGKNGEDERMSWQWLLPRLCVFEREYPDLIKKPNTETWHLPTEPSSLKGLEIE